MIATRPNPDAPAGSPLLVDHLLRAATDHPDEVAVVDGATRMTWAQLRDRAQLMAQGLNHHGVAAGDTVLLQLPNRWETVVATWATWLSGAVATPVVPIYRSRELDYLVRLTRPTAIVTMTRYRGYDHAAELHAIAEAAGLSCLVVAVDQPDEPASAAPGVIPFAQVAAGTPGGIPADGRQAAPLPKDLPPAAAAPSTEALPAESHADDIALVLFTSGTTAAPKGALHTHATLLAEADSIREHCELGPADVVFMPSPLSHITGLSYGVILPAVLGSRVVLLDRWDPAGAVGLVEEEGCTFCVSSTPFLRGLTEAYAAAGGGRSSLTVFVCGGADIPPALVRQARRSLGTRVLRTYGSTEAPTVAMVALTADDESAADHEGAALPGDAMRIEAPSHGSGPTPGTGELLVRGRELFVGYLQEEANADAFTPDGWFRTGDVATIDEQGFLRITGRIKDIVNRAGEKYSATEVEWVLLELPSIREVAIVGVPDADLGERACAFIVPFGDERLTVSDLKEHVVARGLAIQKAPEYVRFVDSLPRTQSGKVQKYRLREAFTKTSQHVNGRDIDE